MKQTFKLVHREARMRAQEAIKSAQEGWVVTLSEPTRTLEQNSAQWPLLQAFADQKQLCINGVMQFVTADDWKDVLTAVFRGEMRVAIFDGRMILLGQRTSEFGVKKFSDWMEFLHASAVDQDVDIHYREAA